MPFIQRGTCPINVSIVEVDPKVLNELECVTNHTLANIIRQLSSLSKHAEDMFYELFSETNEFYNRASRLQQRLDHLRVKVTQLDATVEEVSLQDIHMRKPYISSTSYDQQVVSCLTIPVAVFQSKNKCDTPPALEKLNPYREDGKDSMKFYTDPSYFFELWYAEIQKDIEERRKEVKQRKKRRPRPQDTRKRTPRAIQTNKEINDLKRKGEEYYNPKDLIRSKPQSNMTVPASYVQTNSLPRPGTLEVQPESIMVRQPSEVIKEHKHKNGPTSVEDASVNPRQTGHSEYNSYYQDHGDHNSSHAHQEMYSRISVKSQNLSSPLKPRPSERPPEPPTQGPSPHNDVHQSPRDSLPPPPPPPPNEEYRERQLTPQQQRRDHMLNDNENVMRIPESPRTSPEKHTISPPREMTDNPDLPPPPPSPPLGKGYDQMLPPPSPPPALLTSTAISRAPSPPPPPPPPPMLDPTDTTSISSTTSSLTTASNSTGGKSEIESQKTPANGTERSALLEEIRLGHCSRKLRSVDKKEEEKKKTAGGKLDVHTIMSKAFEMRRKVFETSDSESDDSSDIDSEWNAE